MKVLICGSRNFTDEKPIREVINSLPPGTVIIHGAAFGADAIAGRIAKERGLEVQEYPADWKKYGRAAGPIRNQQMLEVLTSPVLTSEVVTSSEGQPGIVYAFYTDKTNSKGTKNMVTIAKKSGIKVIEYENSLFINGI